MMPSFRSLLVACCLLLTACGTPQAFVQTTGNFAKATDSMAASTRQILLLTNSTNLDRTLFIAEYGLGTIDKEQVRRPLFTEQDLAARMAALDVLSQYAQALESAASASPGPAFASNMNSLQATVLNLETKMKMTGPDLQRLERETGAVAGLVADLGNYVITQVQVQAIEKAILKAQPSIAKLSYLLQQDVELALNKLENAQVLKFAAVSENFNLRACASWDVLTSDRNCQLLQRYCASVAEPPHYCKSIRDRLAFSQKERSELADMAREVGEQVLAQQKLHASYAAAQQGFQGALADLAKTAETARNLQNLNVAGTSIQLFFNQAAELAQDIANVKTAFKK